MGRRSLTLTDEGAVAASRLAPATRPLKPFIKWAGGKTRLLPKLLPHLPSTFTDYYEPFLGGGAMFFAARDRMCGVPHLHDLNEELVNAWLAVRDCPSALQAELDVLKEQDSEEFYYSMRPRQPVEPLERAARFIYLNQTSWNGLWRVNRWGGFNVPWGQRAFRGLDDELVDALEAALKDAVITVEDFRTTLTRPKAGDFVYLDPPYLPISDTSKFYLYTEKRFRKPDLEELAGLCHQLTERGVHWVLSNRDTPLVRELFVGARIVSLTTRRSVAAQNRRDVEKVDSPEVIVIGGPA
ncbi:DNA adenine methylase [Cellulomonas iranensis]|uniref:DNA adenine methylase n=1 Tax=Cellulomonas iranensis TaxID=76862 RepID=UPI0013D31ECE|nr:Dam family site-specific DNA-(adenine-N6)-methyltransferase [Cellulomonas iranensis]